MRALRSFYFILFFGRLFKRKKTLNCRVYSCYEVQNIKEHRGHFGGLVISKTGVLITQQQKDTGQS